MMTEKFVASNGVIVDQVPTTIGNRFVVQDVNPAQREGSRILSRSNWLDPRDADALREFFQQERDLELGRWRWPENPDYVVYHGNSGSDAVWVHNEREDGAIQSSARNSGDAGETDYFAATRAYFAAHPEPKPWMEVPDGVYAVSAQVHPRERLLQKRDGEWLYLYRSDRMSPVEVMSAESVAKIALSEKRLTRLTPEVTK
ncbi:MAG: hypothetical protein IPI55_17075 [Flavobacteriales bacterium]|nr:hypothetical protein [Flavobacteriales bacterium]